MISNDTFLLYNAIISAVFAVFIWLAFPGRLKEPRIFVILLLFCFNFFIPGLGIVGLSIGAVLLGFFRIQIKPREIEAVSMPFFVREKIIKPMAFDESGGWMRAQLKTASSSTRLQSIAAVNAKVSPQANLLNRSMLQENSDEIRLYAFSLLNKQGDQIDGKINQAKAQLDEEKDPVCVAILHKKIALLYWELIYNKLVANELLEFTLEKVSRYLKLALDELPQEVDLYVLSGKLSLFQGEDEKALQAFERARELHAPDEKTIPFLAELYFKKHDFARVKALFKQSPSLKSIPRLGALVKFWCYQDETIQRATTEC